MRVVDVGAGLGGVDETFEEYQVSRVIRSGLHRDTQTWENANDAIRDAKEEGTLDINLRYFEFRPELRTVSAMRL